MDVKQAIEQYLGVNKEQIKSAIECTARLAARAATSLNAVEKRLDEESFTAAFFGALAASLPLGVLAYSRQEGEDYAWLKYDKGSGGWPESESGADFCLVFNLSKQKSRMAIFQAKSDASNWTTDNTLVINQSRIEEGEKVLQVKRLVETASRIESGGAVNQVPLNKLRWVHYLCQFNNGLRCVPISTIAQQVDDIIKDKAETKKSVPVSDKNGIAFISLIADAFAADSEHWKTINSAKGLPLPSAIGLTEIGLLMKVYVITDDQKGWVNELGFSSPTVVSKVKAINENKDLKESKGLKERVDRKREKSAEKKDASNRVVAKKK
ncbi:hypothetical protein XarbCFBP7604_11220 [Xanthomonas arboricola]|uniref:hypothetical protein n=1 Tax=Xanthomonas arboricola TaxID=56448 RepID=UPI000CED8730|nr:hypothetical protein [Xanthomonas arboricola]PPU34380.1 hypothetical protein XarbCFBP7604_11220 [Xanthomonas arboricola]